MRRFVASLLLFALVVAPVAGDAQEQLPATTFGDPPVRTEASDAPALAASDAATAPAPVAARPAPLPGESRSLLVQGLRRQLNLNRFPDSLRGFAQPAAPLASWVRGRIEAHLEGSAVITDWSLATESVGPGDGDVRRLHVRAHLATGPVLDQSAIVRLGRPDRIIEIGGVHALTTPIVAHSLEVRLQPDRQTLSAVDHITFGRRPGRTLVLRLAPCLNVSEVQAAGGKIASRREGELLYLAVPPDANPISVHYAGAWPAGPYDFVGPASVLLRPESLWYPQSQGPIRPARFDVQATGPAGWTILAPGKLAGARFAVGKPINGVSLMGGQWVKRSRRIGPVDVGLYLRRENLGKADGYLDDTGRLMTFLRARLGSYPYGMLSIAETDVAGGYGGQATVSLGSRILSSPRVRIGFLAHEVAHSWTDRLLAEGQEGEIGFISEGLTTYLAYSYQAGMHGVDPAVLRQGLFQDFLRVRGKAGDLPIRGAQLATGTSPWFSVVYQKGALALHDLHRLVGDARFWQVLQKLFASHADKPVRLLQFQRLAEGAVGERLDWWFSQWLDRAGSPELDLADLASMPEGNGFRLEGTVLQRADAYRLKVPLVVDTSGGAEVFTLSLAHRSQRFSVLVPAEPRTVRLDPDYHVLTPRLRPPVLAGLAPGTVAIVVGQQGPDVEERQAAMTLGRTLESQWQQAGASVTVATDTEATEDLLRGSNLVLFVGRPSLNGWVGNVTNLPLSLVGDRFTLWGITYDLPEFGVVQTAYGTWRSDQVVAVYAGLGAPALRQMARLALGASPIEVVAAGQDRVVDTAGYPLADPRLSKVL